MTDNEPCLGFLDVTLKTGAEFSDLILATCSLVYTNSLCLKLVNRSNGNNLTNYFTLMELILY